MTTVTRTPEWVAARAEALRTTLISFGSLLDNDFLVGKERFSCEVFEIFRRSLPAEVADNHARWPIHFNANKELREKAIVAATNKLYQSRAAIESTPSKESTTAMIPSAVSELAAPATTTTHRSAVAAPSYRPSSPSRVSSTTRFDLPLDPTHRPPSPERRRAAGADGSRPSSPASTYLAFESAALASKSTRQHLSSPLSRPPIYPHSVTKGK